MIAALPYTNSAAPGPNAEWSDRLAWVIGASLMAPPAALLLSGGSFELFRAVQIGWIGALILTLGMSRYYAKTHLPALALMLGAFWGPTALAGLRAGLFDGPAISADSVMRLFGFTVVVLAVAAHRRGSFRALLSPGRKIAALFILAATLILLLSPAAVGRRHDFLGHHPNWGGELIFAALIFAAANRSLRLRFACFFAAAIACYLLQARAALMGSAILLLFTELYWLRRSSRFRLELGLFAAALCLFGAALYTVLFPTGQEALFSFVQDRVLLLNDSYRGAGSDLVGRGASFEVVWTFIDAYPILGAGLGNAAYDGDLTRTLHIGPLVLIAEFGVFSLILAFLFARAIWASAQADALRLGVLLASLAIFFFSARSVNLNLFPLMMWLCLLDWPPDRAGANLGKP